MHKTSNSQFVSGKISFLFALGLLISSSCVVAAQDKPSIRAMSGKPSVCRQHSKESAWQGRRQTEVCWTSWQAPATAPTQPQTSKTIVDERIAADPALETLVKPYSTKVRELEVVIGRLDGELRKGGLGAGSLGNFATDGMRTVANRKLKQPVDLAITNGGGLRKNAFWPGELRVLDIFELAPFENQLMTVELTGDQLLKVLQLITGGREAQSGARIRFRVNEQKKTELVSATLIDEDAREHSIDPAATYRVVTVDYLLNVAGGNLSLLAQGKNIKPLGISMRDALIEYVKGETAAGRVIKSNLDGRFSSR
jgi:2',3'-cyclic-nucleotide 2'-phosphodiesterase (5'-nucleotidase family)